MRLRAELKHPKRIRWRSFARRASLVNFALPVTVRLNRFIAGGTGVAPSDDRVAVDLGTSLGTRVLEVDGSLPAEIHFADSYEGGALGNVNLTLLPGPATLKTSSLPILTNHDVTTQPLGSGGCQDFNMFSAGVDDVGLPNTLFAGNPADNPFDLGPGPFSPEVGATAADSVLRTAPLSLSIASPTTVAADGHSVVGKSGGQANLFGKIPGKSYGIDVTATLTTQLSSIYRAVDSDQPVPPGNIASLLDCRQFWTGQVTNTIPVKLVGALHISPGITADGALRIAKVALSSSEGEHIFLQACLQPYATFATDLLGNLGPQTTPPYVDGSLYYWPPPAVPCNQGGGPLDQPPFNVAPLTAATAGDGYTTDETGAIAKIAGDVAVTNLTAEVLVGDR